jgi:nicotinamidase-related amidase
VTGPGWFVAVDLQRVFGDPSSAWRAPRYAAAAANVARLASAFGQRSVFTRFVAPAEPTGAWASYYEEFPWALEPPESRLYQLTDDVAAYAHTTVAATTFGKWTTELRALVGEQPALVVGGVATDCCVISTVLAAADAGASITVATDACAGSSDENHQKALDVMSLYGPLVRLATTDDVLA